MTLIEDINLFRGCNVVNLIKTDEELKESKENLTKENLANKLAKDKINLKEDQIDLKSDDDDVEII